jgi:hypothetical protein
MEKEFVPYELALKIKQIGYKKEGVDEDCFAFYDEEEYLFTVREQDDINEEWLIAPTYSQAFRWFREKHSLFSSILPFQDIEDNVRLCYYYCVINLDESKDEDILCNESSLGASDINLSSPEEAELACLQKLIEIVEQKNP